MKFVKQSRRPRPRVTLVLLDWSVRESFHLMHYLKTQTVPRDDFEVMILEYYSRVSDALKPFEDQVDSWVLMEMPEDTYYHKHLMYNAGIALARGDVVVVCDSDAMVKPTFLESILAEFREGRELALHLDQFRNHRRDMYPFNYPSFDEVLGEGCINYTEGMTLGVADTKDTIHSRNWGACLAARRSDLLAIGGADEHIDYLGHICGPYDLSFRIANNGGEVVWHTEEFMFHTWHPGSDGIDNYLGPHDGLNMSTTSYEALLTRRVMPHVENPVIERLRKGEELSQQQICEDLIVPRYLEDWRRENLDSLVTDGGLGERRPVGLGLLYKGFWVREDGAGFEARPLIDREVAGAGDPGVEARVVRAPTLNEVRQAVDDSIASRTRMLSWVGRTYALVRATLSVAIFCTYLLIRRTITGLIWRWPRRLAGWCWTRWMWIFNVARDRFKVSRSRATESVPGAGPRMTDLMVNLYLGRDRVEAVGGGEAPYLVIDPTYPAPYLRFLQAIGMLPKLKVRQFDDALDCAAFLEGLDETQPEAGVILDANLYIKFFSVLTAHPRVREVMVV